MDLYKEITDRIIAELENGRIPWHQPWVAAGCGAQAVSHVTKKPYSLLNQFLLGRPGEYLTFKQVQKEGGRVRKGEEANMVVFWKFVEDKNKKEQSEPTDKNETSGKTIRKMIPILKRYNVFHIDQCEGIKPKFEPPVLPNAAEAVEAADNIIKTYIEREKITLTFVEGNNAYYRPSTDTIVLPKKEQFKATAEFYGTAFHEMTHSTGHKSRLNRIEKKAAFGNEEYSKEELVAEIGSAALVNQCGIETPDSVKNNAAYIQSWLRALRDDKRFVISAAGKAEKAVKFILGENTKTENKSEAEDYE